MLNGVFIGISFAVGFAASVVFRDNYLLAVAVGLICYAVLFAGHYIYSKLTGAPHLKYTNVIEALLDLLP